MLFRSELFLFCRFSFFPQSPSPLSKFTQHLSSSTTKALALPSFPRLLLSLILSLLVALTIPRLPTLLRSSLRQMSAAAPAPTAEKVLSALKFAPRRSGARGHADHGWLKSCVPSRSGSDGADAGAGSTRSRSPTTRITSLTSGLR